MKKQIKRVLIAVLCCCFVFVAQVDAADVVFHTVDDFYNVFKNSVYWYQSYPAGSPIKTSFSFCVFDAEYNGVKYSFPALYNNDGSASYKVNFDCLTFDAELGDSIQISLIFVPLQITFGDFSLMFNAFDAKLSNTTTGTHVFDYNIDYQLIEFDLIMGDITRTIQAIQFDISFLKPNYDSICLLLDFYSDSTSVAFSPKFAIGMFSPYVSTGLTDEEKSLLQMIMLGVTDANVKLDNIQAEQSSYYDDMIKPSESNQAAAESMSEALESGKVIVDEYSSINDSLEKPNVDQLLPDYDRVVDGYVDTSIFDVFSTLYESGYIMFMILLVVFFGVMSYALFGKKA